MAGSSSASARSSKAPSLVPLGHHTGKPPIPLHRPVTLIGSRSNARIHLTSSSVSKAHALIVKDGPVTYLRDLASRTHVYVGGEQVREQDLSDGDLIKIGSFTFKFLAGKEKPVQAEPSNLPPATLKVSGVDYPVPIDQRVLLIGRRSTCDIHLLEESVSTAHAVLFDMNGQRHIRDLGSRTGTFVNGVQVHQHQLNEGDKIRIGETTLTYTPGEAFAAIEDELNLSGTGASGVDSGAGSAAGASAIPIDDFVVDDADANADARHAAPVEHDLIDLTSSAVPHVSASPKQGKPDTRTPASSDSAELIPLPLDDSAVKTPVAQPGRRRGAAASAENADEAMELSAPGENLRASHQATDTDEAGGSAAGATPESGEEPPTDDAELLPRRGWRTVQSEPETAEPALDESAPAEPVAADQEDTDDSVLKFSPQTTAGAAEEFDLASAETADEGPAPRQDAAAITAGEFSAQHADDSALQDAHAEPLPVSDEEAAEPAIDRFGLDVETGLTAAPSSLNEPVVTEEATIDSATLQGEAASEAAAEGEPAVESRQPPVEPLLEAPLIEPQADSEPVHTEEADIESRDAGAPPGESPAAFELDMGPEKGPALDQLALERPDPEAPTVPIDAPPQSASNAPLLAPDALSGVDSVEEAPPAKKVRGGKSAGGRSRRKKQPAAAIEQVPEDSVEESPETSAAKPSAERGLTAVPGVALGSAEVLDQSEPTPDSALDIGLDAPATTADAPLDEDAIAAALGEAPAAADSLTDTGLAREVRELTGDAGEIVEAPAAEPIKPTEPVAPTARTAAPPQRSEPSAGVPAQPAQAPAAQRPANYRFGANQDNFLGGVPVKLPPLRSPFADKGIVPTAVPEPTAPGMPLAEVPPTEPTTAEAPVADGPLAEAPVAEASVAEAPIAEAPGARVVEPSAPAHEAPPVLDLDDHSAEAHAGAAEEIQEVNALIDEILAPTEGEPSERGAQPPVPESELAAPAATSPTVESPVAPIPLPTPPVPPPAQSRPVIPIPPPPGLRNRRGKRRRGEADELPGANVGAGASAESPKDPSGRALRDDERIPPFKSSDPATTSRVTRGFDGLAMPPVRETDVFSQMSPPAATTTQSASDAFGSDIAPSPSALTPMDLIQAEEPPPRSASRIKRTLVSGRPEVAPDVFFGGGPAPASTGTGVAAAGIGAAGTTAAGTSATGATAPGLSAIGLSAAGRATGNGAGGATAELPGSATVETPEPLTRRRPAARPAVPTAPLPPVPPPIAVDDDPHKIEELGLEDFQAAIEQDQAQQGKRRPPVVYGDESLADSEALAHDQRKRKLRRVPLLLSAMVLLCGITGAAIWYLMPAKSHIEAAIRFENYNLLQQLARVNLQKKQQDFLNADHTRMSAKRLLNAHDAEISPGFLDDNQKYMSIASMAAWPEARKGVMVLRYDGTDEEGDKARLKAMAEALVEANADGLVRDANDARRKYDTLLADIQSKVQQQRELSQEIEKLRTLGDSAPDGAKIQQLKGEVAKLERAWGDALAALKVAQAELQQLKQSASEQSQNTANAAGAAGAGGAAGDAKPTAADSDEQIKQMEAQLAETSEKLSAAQSARAAQAAAARKALDSSLGEFQKQIAEARELMKDSPELAAYITSAQKLQETTRTLIDDLIRRQENYYTRLNDLKQQLTEKMERRRAEQLEADPELKDWNERLQTARRQFNAATASGLKKEAEDAHAQVTLLENMIRNKQELLPGDAFYADAINQLQKIIDATQQNVEDDRKRTDQVLTDLQKGFTNSSAVARLPEAQKSVASSLEQRLADINAARQQYSAALSAAGAGSDDAVTNALRTTVASLQTSIDARRKELAAQTAKSAVQQQEKTRAQAVAAKEKDVLDKTQAELAAREMFTNKERELREAQALAETVRANEDRLHQLQSQKEAVDRQIADARRNEPLFKRDAEQAVKPAAVTDNDVTAVAGADHRIMYALTACGSIFVVFAIMILVTLHGAAQEMSLASLPRLQPSDVPATATPTTAMSDSAMLPIEANGEAQPSLVPNSNGQTMPPDNGPSNGRPPHDDTEEHEPATA